MNWIVCMSKLIFAGLFAEGTTDLRFLESIIKKTLNQIAFECKGDVEIELYTIRIAKANLNFVEQVLAASKKGVEDYGITILCVHTDADQATDNQMYHTKINPARIALSGLDPNVYCITMTAVVPVRMIESWMLADIELLKKEIGTSLSDVDLELHRLPEQYADPKLAIENAIRLVSSEKPKRRRCDFTISDLYLPIGQKMDLRKLKELPSYCKFEESIRNSLRELNLL